MSYTLGRRSPGTLIAICLAAALLVPMAVRAADTERVPAWQAQSVALALQDPSTAVRYEAVKWLSTRHTDGEGLAALVAVYLRSDSPADIRISAAEALGGMGAAAQPFVPQLTALLQDPSARVRDAGVRALGAMGDAADPAAPRIIALLKDPDMDVRVDAVAALGAVRAAAASYAPEVARLLKDPDPHMRAVGAWALANLGRPAAAFAPELVAALSDRDAETRAGAARAVGAMDAGACGTTTPAATPGGAAAACTSPGAPEVLALLKDDSPDVRAAAASALGQMRDTAAIPALGEAVTDNDQNVQATAAQALAAMGASAQLVQDGVSAGSTKAAQALGSVRPADPDAVIRFLGSSVAGVRVAAAQALGAMGDAAAQHAPDLARLLQDSDYNVRFAAALALGRMGAAAAPYAAPIVSMLSSGVETFSADSSGSTVASARASAAQSLGDIGVAAPAVIPRVAALLSDPQARTRAAAVWALGGMGAAAAKYASNVAGLLSDPDPDVRASAASALGGIEPPASAVFKGGGMGPLFFGPPTIQPITARAGLATAAVAPELAAAMVRDARAQVRDSAARALEAIASRGALQDASVLLSCLAAPHEWRSRAPISRLRAYLYRKVSPQDLILIRWLGNRSAADSPRARQLDHAGAVAALSAFSAVWNETESFPDLRKEMAERVAEIVRARVWPPEDAPFLTALKSRLAAEFPDQALAVDAALQEGAWYERLHNGLLLIAAHISAWLALIAAYPRWPWVQSFFFWNRWGRRFLGLGYVGAFVTMVPWLRRRMLLPFRASLLPQGILEQFSERTYFADCDVVLEIHRRREQRRIPMKEMLESIQGPVVVKAPSGLGKTLLLLRLALASKGPVVFLRATECSAGVVAAIQKKVQGQVRDAVYLRTLIYAGALKVLIDGLNEASPDARSRITQFVEEYFRGDFVLTTQPIQWDPPANARVCVLQPLRPEQIEPFLLKQWESLESRAKVSRSQYEETVSRYIGEIRAAAHGSEGTDASLIALSNPMDATLAAELIARGETSPDVFRLVAQRYTFMADSFRELHGRQFPLRRFAERVYEWRKSGEPYLSVEGFEPEAAALAEERLMIQRSEMILKEKGEEQLTRWFFRHDKIMEFFLLPAFMDGPTSTRRFEHVQDEQFFGVYELLAVRLPDDEARDLHAFLVARAADTNQNELVNRYTLALRSRKASARPAASAAPVGAAPPLPSVAGPADLAGQQPA